MKLHKQTRLKAAIAAAVAGLFVALFGLIRSEPGFDAEAETPATPTPTPNYGNFFAPDRNATPAPTPSYVERPPHTRSRAS
jgi:hypothetical protein